MPVTEELLKAASEADVSLVIIGRTAGEDQDNSDTEGSYRLQKEEENLIKSITEVSRRTVVLINSGNIIDMSWVNRYHPQGVLLCMAGRSGRWKWCCGYSYRSTVAKRKAD